MSDRACSRRNEHGRAFLDAGEADALIGSKGRNAETGADLHADIPGKPHGLPRGHRDCLGRGTEGAPPLGIPYPDPLAQTRR